MQVILNCKITIDAFYKLHGANGIMQSAVCTQLRELGDQEVVFP